MTPTPLGRTALGGSVTAIDNRSYRLGVGPIADLTCVDALGSYQLPAWPLDGIDLDGQAA